MVPSAWVGIAVILSLLACSEARAPRETAKDAPSKGPAADDAASRQADSPSAAGEEVMVVARDYAFEVPGPIPAGVTTIRLENKGDQIHHLQLYRLEEGKSVGDLLAALKAAGPSGDFPEWAVPEGGPGGVMPGEESNATKNLTPGTYALVCWVPDSTGAPHLMRGMVASATVPAGGAATSRMEPTADLELELVDYDFRWASALRPGTHTIRVENRGPQRHEVQVWRLAPGKSAADLMTFIQSNIEGREGDAPGGFVGGVSELAAGDHAFMDLPFEPGEYVLICFVPDAQDKKPHFVHGMMKQITVPAAEEQTT